MEPFRIVNIMSLLTAKIFLQRKIQLKSRFCTFIKNYKFKMNKSMGNFFQIEVKRIQIKGDIKYMLSIPYLEKVAFKKVQYLPPFLQKATIHFPWS